MGFVKGSGIGWRPCRMERGGGRSEGCAREGCAGKAGDSAEGDLPFPENTPPQRRRGWPIRAVGELLDRRSSKHQEVFQGIGASVRTGINVPDWQIGQRLALAIQANRRGEDGKDGPGEEA